MEEISDEELRSLSRAILTRYGVDFTNYEPKSLKRRIARAITVFKVESMHGLWAKLLRDKEFIFLFINEITVGLTSMFRDPILWETMRKNVLRKLNRNDQIDIWHAGCSTGEEVYTMGIVLQETGCQDKTRAVATDINSDALLNAQSGNYAKVKIDDYTKNYKEYNSIRRFEKYFEANGSTVHMNKDLIKHVEFKNHNLVSETMDRKFDIIFCRNVMIYFDNDMKKKLLKRFHASLKDGGYFVIGFYDALIPLIDEEMFKFYDLKAKIFEKSPQ